MKEIIGPDEILEKKPLLPTETEFLKLFDQPQLKLLLEHYPAPIEIKSEPGVIQAQIDDWFLYRLRERSNDGQNLPSESQLVDWYYGNPVDRTTVPAVEESTYWLSPHSLIKDHLESEIAEFITNPFAALPDSNDLDELKLWHEKWRLVTTSDWNLLPGQYSFAKIPGLRRHIDMTSSALLKEKGYHLLTAVPTWYHTAKLYQHLGYAYTHKQDQLAMGILDQRLNQITSNPIKQSWLVMRQFWAAALENIDLVPESVAGDWEFIRDSNHQLVFYPLSPERNLWMEKKL